VPRGTAVGIAAAVACALAAGTQPAARANEAACLSGSQAAALVAYTRTGGLAGIRETLTVDRSGRAAATRLRSPRTLSFRLSCTRLKALRTTLELARFPTLESVYMPEIELADGFVETVRYRGRTVRVLTGARVPERLARALTMIQQILVTRR
jgi:hypothetical protein